MFVSCVQTWTIPSVGGCESGFETTESTIWFFKNLVLGKIKINTTKNAINTFSNFRTPSS